MNIYTRNGDFGYTKDINGQRLSKFSTKLMLQGSIDEVNSGIGYLRALIEDRAKDQRYSNVMDDGNQDNLLQLSTDLKRIQHKLFEIGTDISSDFKTGLIGQEDIDELEATIDASLEITGKLNHFIYLSGSIPATWCHTLRSITRRAERDFVHHLEFSDLSTIPMDYKYINRLADYLFQLARHLNHLSGQEEETL